MKEKSIDSPSGGLSNVQYDPKLGRKLKAQKWQNSYSLSHHCCFPGAVVRSKGGTQPQAWQPWTWMACRLPLQLKFFKSFIYLKSRETEIKRYWLTPRIPAKPVLPTLPLLVPLVVEILKCQLSSLYFILFALSYWEGGP